LGLLVLAVQHLPAVPTPPHCESLEQVQAPDEQLCPPAHVCPQAPQLLASLPVLTQAPLHSV
jgi:hypothetical protein